MYRDNLKDYKAGDTKHKFLTLENPDVKAADGSNPDVAGTIDGFAAGLLNIDKGQDIIFPGAFEKDLDEFRKDGVVAYQHDWTSIIGNPTLVEEKLAPEYGLFTKSQIASTTLGNDVMKLVRLKILKKLSIGYRLKEGGYSILNRESLVSVLKERAINDYKVNEILTDFDKRKLSEVFGLFDIKLFEYSVVTRPMNDRADITNAKNDNNLLDGLSFSENPLQVLSAVKGYAERVKSVIESYSTQNRSISAPHRDGIKRIREELENLLPDLKTIEGMSAEEVTDNKADVNKLLTEILLRESKYNLINA